MYLHVNRILSAHWSDRIHDEWINAVLRERPELDPAKLDRTRRLMDRSSRGANVAGYQEIEAGIVDLPDPDDAHVVAVGAKCGASYIVTFNLRDFPASVLETHGLKAIHPDTFLAELLEEDPPTFFRALREHRSNLTRPAKTREEYIATLEEQHLLKTIKLIRESEENI